MQSVLKHLAGAFAVIAVLIALACSRNDQPNPSTDQERANGSQIDVSKTVDLAKKSIEKLRPSLPASQGTKIEVLGGRAAKIAGLVELKMRGTREGRTAVRKVLVTPDLKYIVHGEITPIGEFPRARVIIENVDLKDPRMKGNPNAPLTLVEYADFQCPFCLQTYPVVERVLRENEGKIRFVFKHFPLPEHPWALPAAKIAECARREDLGAFWQFYKFFYADDRNINPDKMLENGKKLLKSNSKVDMDKFTKCFLEDQARGAVKKDYDEGLAIGVSGTPTLLVGDVFMQGAISYGVLNAVVKEALGEKPSKGGSKEGKSKANPG